MSGTEPSDQFLLDLIATGDERAMRQIYERHSSAVAAFAAARLRDRSKAADVLHDVMLSVWRRPEAFSGRSSFRTFLLTMARNKAIDIIRREARIDYGDDGDTLVDHEPTPESLVSAAEDRDRVRACVAALSASHQSAVHLTFFEGLTISEAADVENVPAGTIKTRIYHAKKKLAACLAGTPAG